MTDDVVEETEGSCADSLETILSDLSLARVALQATPSSNACPPTVGEPLVRDE